MIRYILSLFISISIYISLIYGYIYISNKIKKIEPKKDIRVKISILEPKKRLIKSKPKTISQPIIVPPTPKLKPKPKKIIHKHKKNIHKAKKIVYKHKRITHKAKKIVYKHKKNTHKVKKIVYRNKRITHRVKSEPKRENYKTPPPVIYTPEPIIEEIYKEPEIVTPISTPPQQHIERVVKRVRVEATPIKKIRKVDSLAIQKRKFLKRVRGNIYLNRTYPPKAKRRGIEGRVHLVFDITSSGEAINIRTSNAPRILQKSVKRALRQSFPIDIPPILIDKFPMRNISIDIDFKLE